MDKRTQTRLLAKVTKFIEKSEWKNHAEIIPLNDCDQRIIEVRIRNGSCSSLGDLGKNLEDRGFIVGKPGFGYYKSGGSFVSKIITGFKKKDDSVKKPTTFQTFPIKNVQLVVPEIKRTPIETHEEKAVRLNKLADEMAKAQNELYNKEVSINYGDGALIRAISDKYKNLLFTLVTSDGDGRVTVSAQADRFKIDVNPNRYVAEHMVRTLEEKLKTKIWPSADTLNGFVEGFRAGERAGERKLSAGNPFFPFHPSLFSR